MIVSKVSTILSGKKSRTIAGCFFLLSAQLTCVTASESPLVLNDPRQILERTCFQTGQAFSGKGNLGSDVAIVYGIDSGLPDRIETWRKHGYRIHVMTGVSWGHYQDYLYGRFDGTNHVDEAQTDKNGNKISHGSDVYYMCPGENYGKFLSVGVQRALDAGAEAIHLEEPEFWVRGGYSEGFKREWKKYYHEDWQAPHSSVDAQWRASKLKYYLYRRALQQVFDHVQDYNRKTGRQVRCYVPTHSLINYAQWRIVSPESSLAQLNGCDGYIAQVWTGTSRTPNFYAGKFKERTFETAFLEYGAMQNLVRSTGRRVWYLNDPIEDNPDHTWVDYKENWESTLVASLLHPEVSHFEVAPWPESIFGGKYPRRSPDRKGIPPEYATELQTVMNALNNMNQKEVRWDAGSEGFGVLISDSLMFERGEPNSSDEHLSHFYGMALPLVKRGIPVTPVQLENVTIADYLDNFKVLLLSYVGMKPLTPEVHDGLAKWVKSGGTLLVIDDDSDPYNKVRDWWNEGTKKYQTPREHLFETLGQRIEKNRWTSIGEGQLFWTFENPAALARRVDGADRIVATARDAAQQAKINWRETNYLQLRRGPYVIAAGLDESLPAEMPTLKGRFVNLFDSELAVNDQIPLRPASRYFLVDLDKLPAEGNYLVASGCKSLLKSEKQNSLELLTEGVEQTPGIALLHLDEKPKSIRLDGEELEPSKVDGKLVWLKFENKAQPRRIQIQY
ncbi:MAG: hypothetical protein ACTHMT_11630 [Verrucomicrobiota bacterium]